LISKDSARLTAVYIIYLFGGTAISSAAPTADAPNELSVTVGKSVVVSSSTQIERVAVGFGEVAEAMAVGPNEVLVSGKAPGSTSLIVWQQGGGKLLFDVAVRPNAFLTNTRLDSVRREIARELPGQDIAVRSDNDTVFLSGKAKDLTSVGRAVAIASTVGKVVNLLYVDVPQAEAQILLKVRFASLDRARSNQLGVNLFSTGAANTIGTTSTKQFPPPTLPQFQQPNNATRPFVFSDLLNIFLFRPDLNLGATIQALEQNNVLEMLAEPNVLSQDGKQASFLAGGQFPYPVVQSTGTSGVPVVTIQFHDFGVRLDFIPTITPRGTIRLQVAPEVSALDYTNGLTIEGFTVPGLNTRRVNTEVELGEGQSFAIAGLLDKRLTDSFQKMPLIGDLPVLGKFFQSKSTNRSNTELLVIVTPELVRPMPAGAPPPGLPYPKPFMDSSPGSASSTLGMEKSGPARVASPQSMPVEALLKTLTPEKPLQLSGTGAANAPAVAQQQNVTNELQPAMSGGQGQKNK